MADRFDDHAAKIGGGVISGRMTVTSLAAYLRSEFGKECEWTYDEGVDYTECGLAWECNNGTAEENGMIYCPKCGGKITRAKG